MPDAEREVHLRCRAKLNLALEIVRRRPDGLHDIATVMHPIRLCDDLTVRLSRPGIELSVTGLPSPGGEGNTAYRAAVAFADQTGIPPACEVHLHKRVPAEAGLAGGSADAAGVLKGLALLHGHPRDDPRMLEAARSVGADVPFFLGTGAALAEGIGDRLTPLPSADFACVLVLGTPGVSTGWAYSCVRPEHYSDGRRAWRVADLLREQGCIEELPNSFLAALAEERPDLVQLVSRVAGLVSGPSGLTGSGACVFGLAAHDDEARHAAEALSDVGYWSWGGPSATEPISVESVPTANEEETSC